MSDPYAEVSGEMSLLCITGRLVSYLPRRAGLGMQCFPMKKH